MPPKLDQTAKKATRLSLVQYTYFISKIFLIFNYYNFYTSLNQVKKNHSIKNHQDVK